MNPNNYLGIALEELYRIFEILNVEYFSNKLPYPMITIQKTKRNGNLGWFTLDQVWENINSDEKRYEINICAEYLSRDVYELVSTLQHKWYIMQIDYPRLKTAMVKFIIRNLKH